MKYLGGANLDLMKYKAIFERNADRLVNANAIYEGQVIVLPAKHKKCPPRFFEVGIFSCARICLT